MNLFEGRVTSFRGGVLEVTISGLGRLEIPHDAEPSGEIGIAIRPVWVSWAPGDTLVLAE